MSLILLGLKRTTGGTLAIVKTKTHVNPYASIELYKSKWPPRGQTYLRVQERPGANPLTGFFPAQDASELERKKHEVRGERGEDRGSGIHEMVNLTNISSPAPARYGRS